MQFNFKKLQSLFKSKPKPIESKLIIFERTYRNEDYQFQFNINTRTKRFDDNVYLIDYSVWSNNYSLMILPYYYHGPTGSFYNYRFVDEGTLESQRVVCLTDSNSFYSPEAYYKYFNTKHGEVLIESVPVEYEYIYDELVNDVLKRVAFKAKVDLFCKPIMYPGVHVWII